MPTQDQIIDDPFSSEFMEEANNVMQTIHVSAASLPKRRVKQDKFVIHPDLKKRLVKLHNTDVAPIVKEMIMRILTMKHVRGMGKYCNYLGLSQADFTKISYLDQDRKNRLEGQVVTQHIIKPGTQIVTYRKRSYVREGYDPIYKETLTLNSRHLNDLVYPIKEFVPTLRNYTYAFYTSDQHSNFRNAETKEGSLTVNIPHLEQDAAELRIQRSRTIGRNEIVIGQQGIVSISTYNLIGVEFKNTETTLKEVWNYKQRYHTSIGKIIRRLFGHEFCDNDITKFAEAYSGLITVANPYYDFTIVDGKQIAWAYHEDNYFAHSNSLGNSCMRHSRCQNYFDIYVNFPDIVKLAILTRSGKVAARCLVWKTEDGWLYDRIYSTKLETEQLLRSTMENNNYKKVWQQCRPQIVYDMNLSETDYFPYMDTFSYYLPEDQKLANYLIDDTAPYYSLRSTSGSYESCNNGQSDESEEVCECCGNSINDGEGYRATIGRYEDYILCQDCEVYSNSMDATFSTNDAYVNTYEEDPILVVRAIRLSNNDWAYEYDDQLAQFENGFGWFIRDIHPHYRMDDVYYDINDPNKQGTPTNFKFMEFAENIPAEAPIQIPVEPLINSMGTITYHTGDFGVLTSTGNVAIGTILSTNSFNVTYPHTLLSENEIEEMVEIMVEDNNEEHLI